MTENNPVIDRAKLIQNLVISIRHISIYPAKHPIVINSIKNVLGFLNNLYNSSDSVNITVSPDNKVMVNSEPVDANLSGDTKSFLDLFRKLSIEDLSFIKGVNEQEIGEFIKLALLDPAEISKTGKVNDLFAQKGISNIKAKQFSYIKVEKGAAPVAVSKEPSALDKIKSKLKNYFDNKITDEAEADVVEKTIFESVSGELKEKGKIGIAEKNILKKFIMRAPVHDEAAAKLKQALIGLGCPADDIEQLIKKVLEDIEKGPSAKKEVLSGDAQSAVRENELLKKQLSQLQEQLGRQTEMIAQLEKRAVRLSDEKQRIDNIIHNMAEGMVVVDAQGKIMLVNQAAESLLGISKDDVGKLLKEVVKDEHLLTVARSIAPAGETVEKDIELLSGDESTKRVLRTSSAVVEDPNGNTVGMVTTLNDITRQREVEKIKAEFLANVSHELRTPLVAIQKSIAMILDKTAGEISPTQQQFISIADRNSKRLTLLINDLLDLAKLEARRMQLKRQLAGLDQVISEAVTSLEQWAKTKSVSIETDISAGLPLISADPNRLVQVLVNLIGNAIKFTPANGKITVSCSPSADGSSLEVRVKDTGVGIPKDDLNKIFDKFYQTKERPVSDISGTGIGLAIVKEIVELHGGKVWAESEPGSGAVFIFTMPLAVPEETQQGG